MADLVPSAVVVQCRVSSERRSKCSEKRHTPDKVMALLLVVNIKRVDAHCAGSQFVSLVMGTDGALHHAFGGGRLVVRSGGWRTERFERRLFV